MASVTKRSIKSSANWVSYIQLVLPRVLSMSSYDLCIWGSVSLGNSLRRLQTSCSEQPFMRKSNRPVAEKGTLPPDRAIYGMMFFLRSFWCRIRIWMLIGRTRRHFQDIGGRGQKVHISFILNIKIYNSIIPITLPTKVLYDTTKTLTGRAIYHDYSLAFNKDLRKYN